MLQENAKKLTCHTRMKFSPGHEYSCTDIFNVFQKKYISRFGTGFYSSTDMQMSEEKLPPNEILVGYEEWSDKYCFSHYFAYTGFSYNLGCNQYLCLGHVLREKDE